MNMKKFAAAFAALALCVTSAFAAKPLEGKKLKMAVSPTFPPFEFEQLDDKGNANIVGYDIDMVNEIASRLGFTYDIVHTNFKGLLGELSGARVDFVVSGMSPTEERKKTVDFSVPYYYCQTSIIQHKGTNIKNVADMKGKKIAAVFGTQYCDFATAVGADVKAMDNATYSMQELLAGRVDGVVQDAASASVRIKTHPEFEYFVLPREELDKVYQETGANVSGSFAAVFPKGSTLEPLFTEEIKKMQADGSMKAIYEKWIGPWPYTEEKPLAGKHLKMAISPTFPPFEFEQLDDKGNANIVGYDIDMVNYIADKLGFTYDIVHTNFKGLLGELSGARVDFVVSGMSATEERRKSVDFSVPYYSCQTSIIQHKGTNIKSVADMKDKKIAAVFGTQYCDFAEAVGAKVSAMDNATYSMQELLAGRVDGVVQDAASASVRIKTHPELEYFVLPQADLDKVYQETGKNVSDSFAAVFPKGSTLEPLFSKVITEMKEDGAMKAIYEKWIGPWPY